MFTFIKRLFLSGLLVGLLAACAPAKTPAPIPLGSQGDNPYAP